MHPYMTQGVAHERIADLLRVAKANQKARDGARPGARRQLSWRPRRDQGSVAALCEVGC